MPMPIMTKPNSASSSVPPSFLPRLAPANARTEAAAANTSGHGHFTVPSRAWLASPRAGLSATATAEEPMATWADANEEQRGLSPSSDEPERKPDKSARGEEQKDRVEP